MKKLMIHLIMIVMMISFFISCTQIPLSDPHEGKEEVPLSGPKRAVLAEIHYPANLEGQTDESDIQKTYLEWANTVKLQKSELDIIRKIQGGELKYVLEKIKNNKNASNLIYELRKKGVIFSIHPQQILGSSLPKNPVFNYSEALEKDYIIFIFNRSLELLDQKNPNLSSKIKSYYDEIILGMSEEINNKQTFPYSLNYPRLTHSFNPDSNWSLGYSNIKGANALDGFHNAPPGILLKALGLAYGMKKVIIQENFFSEEIKTEESYQEGFLSLYSKGKKKQACNLLGRMIALIGMASLPNHLDSKYPEAEDIYRNQFLPIIIKGISEIVSKPDALILEAQFFDSGWRLGQYKNEVVNYIENEMLFAGNLSALFMKMGQRADFYPTTHKYGNEISDFSQFTPYYPYKFAYQYWNYFSPSTLLFTEGNAGAGNDRVVVKAKDGKIYTAHVGLIEMAIHLQPMAIAGLTKLMELMIK